MKLHHVPALDSSPADAPPAEPPWEEPPRRAPLFRLRYSVTAVLCLGVAVLAWWAVHWLTSPAPLGPATPAPAAASSAPAPQADDAGPAALATAAPSAASSAPGVPTGVETVAVHVIGEVNEPTVVTVPAGARVADAVRAAGGPTRAARMDRINMAAPVQDGQQVLIPSSRTPQERLDALQSAGEQAAKTPAQDTSVTDPAATNSAATDSAAQGPPAGGSAAEAPAASAQHGSASGGGAAARTVNLNTADAAALETLPGVGPKTAAKILAHRESVGPFQSLADLQAVPGIGPATLERLRDQVSW
ncbi:MAG: ComEA family DNA-binding protein [Micrococcus sp.]|nr:ComEA family DNA-binding protein [Micrococcus sp.]